MKALTSGVNFCTCEDINCFLEILSTNEFSKILTQIVIQESRLLSSTALDKRHGVLLRMLKA